MVKSINFRLNYRNFPSKNIFKVSFQSMSRKQNTLEKYLKQEVKEKNNHSNESAESSTRPTKKAKKDETNTTTTTKIPESLFFEKREGTVKLASWNVSGLNAALKKV